LKKSLIFPGRGELQGTKGNERNYQVATILTFRQCGKHIQWLARPRRNGGPQRGGGPQRNSSRLAASLTFDAMRLSRPASGKLSASLGCRKGAFAFIYRVDVRLEPTRVSTPC